MTVYFERNCMTVYLLYDCILWKESHLFATISFKLYLELSRGQINMCIVNMERLKYRWFYDGLLMLVANSKLPA